MLDVEQINTYIYMLLESLLGIALFGSFLWFLLLVAAMIILLVSFEANESGTGATLSFIGFLALCHFGGALKELTQYFSWGLLGAYLTVGFIYALIRFYGWGRKFRETDQKNRRLPSFEEKRNNALRWWLNWPASIIWWTMSDLLRFIWNKIYSIASKTFDVVFNAGVGDK